MRYLIENVLCCREGSIGRGNTRVDGHMHEYLRDFARIDPDIAARLKVQGQFFTALSRQNRDRHQASRPPIQVRSGPERTPGRLCDESLKVGVEPGCTGLRSLDVFASKYLRA